MDKGEIIIGEIGEDGEPITALSMLQPELQRRVLYLKNLQDEYDEKDREYEREQRALEQKYAGIWGKIFAKRAEVIKGDLEAPEEIQVEQKIQASPSDPAPKGIPRFWLQALQESSTVSEMITEKDEEVLEYLVDVRSEEIYPQGEEEEDEGVEGFTLTFEFSENPFFTNKTLSKTYRANEDGITAIEGSEINWKPGKNITVKVLKKRVGRGAVKKGGKPSDLKSETKVEKLPSFFHFFQALQVPDSDTETEAIAEAIQEDYEIGEYFSHQLIPNAVNFFLGEVDESEEDEEGDFDDEDDEDEDDDEDDEDDDDDDEDEDEDEDDEDDEDEEHSASKISEKKPLKKHGRTPKDKAGKEQPAECKQQ